MVYSIFRASPFGLYSFDSNKPYNEPDRVLLTELTHTVK